jgi:plastocyanin
MRLFLALILLLAGPLSARAADLAVTVRTAAGKPVADAVVMVRPQAGAPRGLIRFPWPYRMAQQAMKFAPFVLVVPVGADVSFPNLDLVLHHVYSFSPAKTFELKLYGHDETRNVRFDKAGVVAVGCNIHDSMVGFIRVVDTPYAAKTNAAGEAVIHDLPAGPASLVLWHPYLRAPHNELARTLSMGAADQRLALVGELRTPPMRRGGY